MHIGQGLAGDPLLLAVASAVKAVAGPEVPVGQDLCGCEEQRQQWKAAIS
jgi:hypothetical protein